MVAVPAQDDLRRVLDDDGKPLPGAKVPSIPDAALQRMFETMLLVRIMDDRMMQLHRQGRLGFYMKATGEEATHFAVAPLRDSDWIFPSYREQGAWFWRGYTIQQYIDQLFGNVGDPIKGRQMPVHHSASWLNIVSISSPVGTQIPQAVGAAYAAKVMGKDDVAVAFFGEGASANGELHVGLNFAGVWKAPCIFLCRNNVAAPHQRQSAARTLAARAVGYGMPGIRVDGNDVLAIWQVTSDAAERARAGGGPTFIEALTYRPADDAALPERRDPLARFRSYLRHCALWSESWEQELSERYQLEITDALAAADHKPPPAVETMFDDVYDQLPSHLREQRASLKHNG
jgi:TPP-dependent pyruvate/acetoin dehydrogenase alpha subunit